MNIMFYYRGGKLKRLICWNLCLNIVFKYGLFLEFFVLS